MGHKEIRKSVLDTYRDTTVEIQLKEFIDAIDHSVLDAEIRADLFARVESLQKSLFLD